VAQAVIIFSALIVIVLAVAEYGFSSDNSTWDFHLDAMTIFGVLFMGLFAYPVITYIDVRLVQSVGAVRQLLVYFGVPIVALVMKYLFNVENNDTSVSGLLLNVFGSFLAVIGSMLALRDSEKEYKAGLVSIDGMEERMLPSSSENSSGVRGGELDGLGAPMSDLGPFHFHSQNVEETAGIAESYRPAGRIQSFRF
jgi:hypothetical protein